jgi:hypothetical protein
VLSSRTYTTLNDFATEGTETLSIQVSFAGFNLGTAQTLTITDTSLTPTSGTISPSTTTITEGNAVTFTCTINNSFTGTAYYSVNNVTGTMSTADFADSLLSGSFAVTNGSGSFSKTLVADGVAEAESFSVSLRYGSIFGTIFATTSTITVTDAAVPTIITLPTSSSVNDPISAQVCTYYTDNSLSGLTYSASSTRIINSTGTVVTAAWCYGTYSGRTYAPLSTFCNARAGAFPYSGSSWESAWWLSTTSPADTLIIQLNNKVTLSSITFGTPYEIYSSDGNFSAYVVTAVSGSSITAYSLIGTANIPFSTTTMNTISATGIQGNIFFFKRSGAASWSRLEEIRLNCV